MAYTLGDGTTTVQLNIKDDTTYGSPQIQNMKRTTESQIWKVLIPTSGPETVVVLDLMGTERNIILSGIVTGTVTQLDSFVVNLEAFMNSQQYLLTASGLTFTADRPASTSITVIMRSFDWEYDAGIVNKLIWSIALTQGNS